MEELAYFWEFRYIMAHSFEEDEAEHLEDFAEWHFEQVEKGNEVRLPQYLILEVLELYKEDNNEEI